MKRMLSSVMLLALVSAPAFALPARMVAEVRTGGGLMPMPYRGVRIYSNGALVKFTANQFVEIGRLTLDQINKVAAAVEQPFGPLVDLDADKPMCADAPSTKYQVLNGLGTTTVLAKNANCHRYEVQGDNAGTAYLLVDALKGLESLSVVKP